jgi:acetyltransferase-like isoleucine patch superfamily enzyme
MERTMAALREIGLRKAAKFGITTLALVPWRWLLVPQARAAYLRLLGARVAPEAIIHDVTFFNAYRSGFAGLQIGRRCFLGEQCLLDLADRIELHEHVTLAERVTVLTHTNVGYADHPLQRHFPPFSAPVIIERGAFVGVNATIMPGVRIGQGAFVGAGSLVRDDVPPGHVVGGVPARVLRVLT